MPTKNSGGYVQLHRGLLDHPLMVDLPAAWFRVWIWILLRANWKPGTWWNGHEEVTINPGSLVTSLEKISLGAATSKQQTRGALGYFQKTQMVTLQTTNKFTVITVCNWDIYQGGADSDNTQSNTQRNSQTTHEQHAGDLGGNNNLRSNQVIKETDREISDDSFASRKSTASAPELAVPSPLSDEIRSIRGEHPPAWLLAKIVDAVGQDGVTAFTLHLRNVHARYRPGGHRAVSTWKWFEATASAWMDAQQSGRFTTELPADTMAEMSSAFDVATPDTPTKPSKPVLPEWDQKIIDAKARKPKISSTGTDPNAEYRPAWMVDRRGGAA